MSYIYQSDIHLGEVVLNVQDLKKQTEFYTTKIGFVILHQTAEEVQLGILGSDAVLLRLIKTDLPVETNYGLYHTAILVPDRPSLGASLHHLLRSGVPLTGGADHGYSEAIYLDDPERNGIEIYRDKPVEQWDIRSDGRIIGVTEEMDADGVLAESLPASDFHLAAGTTIGHVHLSVKNALASSRLYQKIFSLGDKMTVPSASWIASGDYHHHLAFNQWAGPNLLKRSANRPGLRHLSIEFQDAVLYQASLKKARLAGVAIVEENEHDYLMEDSDGIRTRVLLKSNE